MERLSRLWWAGVGIGVRRGEGIHDPGEAAIVADDDVGILIEGEERRQGGDAIADVAAHEQAALGVHVVAEGQLGEIAAVEGEQKAAQEAANYDAAGAFIGGEVVGSGLRGS